MDLDQEFELAGDQINDAMGRGNYEFQDRIVSGYPPLHDHRCFTLAFPAQRNRPMQLLDNCAGIALLLAMRRLAHDEPKQSEPSCLLTDFPNGATVPYMIRRLQRFPLRGATDYPVYVYRKPNHQFVLVSGRPREDHWAMLFIPADPLHGFQAHWTTTTIAEEQPVEIGYASPNAVIYTAVPFTSIEVFWRAEVTSQNKAEFDRQRELGQACDCDWSVRCHHEELFRTVNGGDRITIHGSKYVFGTRVGRLCSTRGDLRMHLGKDDSVLLIRGGQQVRVYGITRFPVVKRQFMFRMPFSSMDKFVAFERLEFRDYGNFRIETALVPEPDHMRPVGIKPWLRKCALNAGSKLACGFELQEVITYCDEPPPMPWAYHADLSLRLPREHELMQRLALRKTITVDSALDTIRRMANEEGWQVEVHHEEMAVFLDRIVTEVGNTPQPLLSAGTCYSCLKRVKTYRHECKLCKQRRTTEKPEQQLNWDAFAIYVGYRGLWSREFELPKFEVKDDLQLTRGSRRHLAYRQLIRDGKGDLKTLRTWLKCREGDISCRGRNTGPIFENMEPSCYKRGSAVAVQAFLVRLGVKREHEGQDWAYDLAFALLISWVGMGLVGMSLEPESHSQFMSHFSGDKKAKMELAHEERSQGWLCLDRLPQSGFTKAEKSMDCEWTDCYYLKPKLEQKPRFICSPNPVALYELGRYTHPQLKWMTHVFPADSRLFYAGCANPETLNEWLNRTLEDIPEPWTVVDDITAIDSNHGPAGFRFHDRVRARQFPKMPASVAKLYDLLSRIVVRIGEFVGVVTCVNGSGAPDTSYRNTLICILARAIAITYALVGRIPDVACVLKITEQLWLSASGDDGIVRLPSVIFGYSVQAFDAKRYREAWSWFGFTVKVQVLPPNRWRMATYLAMRPVWAGTRYEWAAEPARRLRGLFWQIDCFIHPEVYGRSIAQQNLAISRHCPVLSDICQWYLEVVGPGPVVELPGNEYSPFYRARSSSNVTERGIEEFCVDYRIDRTDYERFVRMLREIQAPLVTLSSFVLHRIFAEES